MATEPTTPGIAELLDAYGRVVFSHALGGANPTEVTEAHAAVLAHVAAIEAQRDAWHELAEHQRYCATCAEEDVTCCAVGGPMYEAAIAQRWGNDE
jgi:hypothetical protein